MPFDMDTTCLASIRDYLKSGRLEDDWQVAEESERYEVLDVLELLMELGELADAQATKVIFKGSFLEQLAGLKDDDESGPKQ